MKQRRRMTVSELVAFSTCEAQAMFDLRYGKKRSRAWRKAAREGRQAHRKYARHVAFGRGAGDPRCFIATAIFGADATETKLLREFRDSTLKKAWAGRMLISLYYRLAPAIARFCEKSPLVSAVMQRLLKGVLSGLERRK